MAGTQDLKFRIAVGVTGQSEIAKLRGQLGGLNDLSSTLKKGLGALGIAFGVREVLQFGQNLLNTADELRNVSQKTGIAVKDLAGFQAAAEQADVPFENLAGSLRKFSINLVEASTGNRQTAAAFRSLGVTITEANGQLRPSGDLIKEIADRFQGLKDGPEKAAIAVKLFGKSGADMIPFLNEGSEALTKFGLAIDDEFANRADAFNDTISRIGTNVKSSAVESLKLLLPTLQEIASAFEDVSKKTNGPIGAMDILGETLRVLAVTFNYLKEIVVIALDGIFTSVVSVFKAAFSIIKGFVDSLANVGLALAKLGSGDVDGAIEAGRNVGVSFNKGFADGFKDLNQAGNGIVNRAIERAKSAYELDLKLAKNSLLFGSGSQAEIEQRQKDDTKPAESDNAKKLTADISELAKARGSERDRVSEFAEQQRLENEQRLQALNDINLTKQELEKVIEVRKIEQEAIKQGKTLNQQQREELARVTAEIIKQREAVIELEQAQKRSISFGFKSALRDIADEAGNLGKQIEDATKNAFKGMEDALVSFVTTGKLNFSDLAKSILEDLARIAIRQAIIAPLAGALGGAFSGGAAPAAFANGGIMTGSGPVQLRKYAAGGVANSPQLALFGEGSRPEAYVPLPDGRRIPVAMQGGAGGGTSVVVNVNMQTGQETTEATGQKGKQLGQLISAAVKSELVQQKRPGGLLA